MMLLHLLLLLRSLLGPRTSKANSYSPTGGLWCGGFWCGRQGCGGLWCGGLWCGWQGCGGLWCGGLWCGRQGCGGGWRWSAEQTARVLGASTSGSRLFGASRSRCGPAHLWGPISNDIRCFATLCTDHMMCQNTKCKSLAPVRDAGLTIKLVAHGRDVIKLGILGRLIRA